MPGNNSHSKALQQCPICASRHVQLRYNVNKYKIFSCSSCQGGFTFPRPEALEVPEIYGEGYLNNYKQTPSHGEEYSDWRFDCLSKLIETSGGPLSSINKRYVLDIGCATGYFLSRFKEDGWETTGVDVSHQSAEYAKKKFGLNVIVGDFLGADIASHSYDLVLMIHVIEHFIDPNKTLQKVRDILKRGGLFFLETPNWDGIGSIIQKERWSHLIPPEHLNFFGPSSMRIFTEQNQFQILSMTTVTPPYLESIQGYPKPFRIMTKLMYEASSLLQRGPTLQVLLRRE